MSGICTTVTGNSRDKLLANSFPGWSPSEKMKKFIEDLIVTTEMVSLEHEIKDFLIENNEKEDENDK